MGDIDVEAQETVAVPVTWNDADRDAGIDHWIANAKFWHEQCIEAWRLRDANAAEVERLREWKAATERMKWPEEAHRLHGQNARLRSVVAGVEALAEDGNSDIEDEIEEALERSHGANHYGCCFTPGIYAYGCTDAVKRRLRSLLSDTKEDAQ